MPRFAAIGLDHRHIYDLTQDLLDAGAECVGYNPDTTDARVLAGFRKRFPHVPASETKRLLEDPSIDFVVIAARPCDRADLAIAAMQRGKDVMVDKPGITTLDQLAAVERAVKETGRIWSICLGRLASPAVQEALRIVRSGELGRLVHTTSLGPHRLNRELRPSWFFDTPAYGGIINDIGVHSIDQFLAFAEAGGAEIVSCSIGAFGTEPPGFEDFAELVLATPSVRGYIRLDWFTPDGLPTWGDGRFFVVGTEGTLELRKNLDIQGRAGTDHMFVANKSATRYIDCSRLPVTLLSQFPRRHRAPHRDRDAATPDLRRLPPRVARAGAGDPLYGEAAVIGIAVIGLGNALQPHARGLVDLAGRVRVVWAAASSEARLKDVADRYGFPTTTDVARAIADPAVDAVMVLTPANAHLPIAEAAFAAGKHVLCEKPLEVSIERGEQLIAAGRRANRRLGICLQLRFRPGSLRLREALREGGLGEIQAATMMVPWWRPQSYYDEPGRGVKARDGGGVLITQAIHNLDLFRWLVGIERIEAAQVRTTALHRMETEDYASALVRLGNGAPGTIVATVAAWPGSPEWIHIIGSKGSARLEGGSLRIAFIDGREEVLADTSGSGSGANVMSFSHEAHRAVLTDFLDAIEQGRDPAVPGEEALATQRVIESILEMGGR